MGQIAQPGVRTAVHAGAGDVLAVQLYGAAVGGHQAHNHVEAGGFAGAVGPEQADDFACVNLHGHALHNRSSAIALGQVGGYELASVLLRIVAVIVIVVVAAVRGLFGHVRLDFHGNAALPLAGVGVIVVVVPVAGQR